MKRHAPATARNSGPLADVLAEELPPHGLVLEIASGSGEHAVYMARRFASLAWQPSDVETDALRSVDAWAAEAGLGNLLPAIALDAVREAWPLASADAVLCVNMVHISEWAATEGLFAGSAQLLGAGSPLILYGPYLESDVETAPSNLQFDRSLKARNREWGLRNLADVDGLATRRGFERTRRVEMPANNLVLVYRKRSGDS